MAPQLTLTPGFRLEHIKTKSEGSYKNIAEDLAGNVILNEEIDEERTFDRTFLLLGIGATYKLVPGMELYANFSQNYRSVTFNDIQVVNPSFEVDPNISDEDGFTADIGARGRFKDFLSYDASIFGLLYDDRLGEVLKNQTRTGADGEEIETGNLIRFRGNVGTAFIYGLESFGDWNIKGNLLSDRREMETQLFYKFGLDKVEIHNIRRKQRARQPSRIHSRPKPKDRS